MSRPVERREILDFVTYAEQRDAIRAAAMAAKDARRVHLGANLTFLFENHETIRYQVLEMVRAEQMVRESDIQHELETYNALMTRKGELGCTLLIEIPEESERAERLRAWRDLPRRIALSFRDGTQSFASVDEDQFNEEKASSVQFLKFRVDAKSLKGLSVDHPSYQASVEFSEATLQALGNDLANG
jgi:Protein of unknown function (DUF3501)